MNLIIFILFIIKPNLAVDEETGYCNADSKSCKQNSEFDDEKLIFYDVNPQEGFNLRRDVYMRFAIMMAEAQQKNPDSKWKLVLPPWYRMYHWRSEDYFTSKPVPWAEFFNIKALKSYAPVMDLVEVFSSISKGFLQLDRLYVLQNFPDAFEGGIFKEKWKVNNGEMCEYIPQFWGYKNITIKEVICVQFQGKVSKLFEILALHPSDTKVMFAHGEIALHDQYGGKEFWDCRRSMKFNQNLIRAANTYIKNSLQCTESKCSNYVSVHWRRQDFAQSRKKDVPSLKGTAKQIDTYIKENIIKSKSIFIATDANWSEVQELMDLLSKLGYKAYVFLPTDEDLETFKDGSLAIIEQIICSRASHFIGTHESTYTFRIQEEREILGFPSKTTFNRLCPDSGKCEKGSKWTIVL